MLLHLWQSMNWRKWLLLCLLLSSSYWQLCLWNTAKSEVNEILKGYVVVPEINWYKSPENMEVNKKRNCPCVFS
ncbi:hypothetical protein, partial [Xanthovirga aplysinae]|uniref:hypothetical protein n=1 Tax=Xanthovirga aplysinae TaxID=2529853 RepID=UPI001CA43BE2